MTQKTIAMFAPNCIIEFDEVNDKPSIFAKQEFNRGAILEITAGLADDVVTIYFNESLPQDFVDWIGSSPILIQAIETVGDNDTKIDLEFFDTEQDNEDDRGNHVQETLTSSWADYDIPVISGGTFTKGYPFKFKIVITFIDAGDTVKLNLALGKYDDV